MCVCVCACVRVRASATYSRAPDKRTHFLGNVILQAKQDCIEGY